MKKSGLVLMSLLACNASGAYVDYRNYIQDSVNSVYQANRQGVR